MTGQAPSVLTLNSGSSSLKAALFSLGGTYRRVLSAEISGIGEDEGRFHVTDEYGDTLLDKSRSHPHHDSALDTLLTFLRGDRPGARFDVVGHRIVHGGRRFRRAQAVNDEVLAALRDLVPLAPDHLPQEIRAIETVRRAHPGILQVACFDTSFHRDLPEAARAFALPREQLGEDGIRFGFHGLSYEYITGELARRGGGVPPERAVIAHLGNGASMVAVRRGRSVDTTMGLTPLGGLVMGTRPGDIDPGVLVRMVRENGLDPDALDRLLNHRSGLLALSGTTPDMKDLLDAAGSDARAALAVEVFCRQARKHLAAMASVLGGLDTLVFTGGIGEKAATVRERIVAGLDFMGIRLDAEKNRAGSEIVSPEGAPVTVRVMHTDEELVIARHAAAVARDHHAGSPASGRPAHAKEPSS